MFGRKDNADSRLDYTVRVNVLFLCRVQADKPFAIAVKGSEGLANLGEPKIEIGYVPDKLVTVEGDKSLELVGDEFGHVGGIRHRDSPSLHTPNIRSRAVTVQRPTTRLPSATSASRWRATVGQTCDGIA